MGTQRIAVFTAIDDAPLNRTMVERWSSAGIPVIPISSRTLEEIAPIAAELGLQTAMVIESGGAIARWKNGAWEVEPCGPSADALLDIVSEIEDRSGANLLVYSAMEASDAAKVSGLSGERLQASTRRSFSEPFLIESGDLEAIERAAAEVGFSVRKDQRFFHLSRECDEGTAFTRIRKELHCDVAIGVGGSAADAEFLTRADIPIIFPGTGGASDVERIATAVDEAVRSVNGGHLQAE
jgi:mannosyl-3-phosphoglycerate phosphatase